MHPHTPVSDGKSVFSYFGTDGLWAFDLDGKKLWHLESGTEKHPNNWGTGASPIVHRQFVIINAGIECGKLIAADKATGKIQWEYHDETLKRSFSTPVIAKSSNGEEITVHACGKVFGLNPANGEEIWFHEYTPGFFQSSSPVVMGNSICCWNGYSTNLFAIPLGQKGEIHERMLRKLTGPSSMTTSQICAAQKILCIGQSRIVKILNSTDGSDIHKERLGNSKTGEFHASPIRIRNRWVLLARNGDCHILPDGEVTSKATKINRLIEDVPNFEATPAVTDKEILIRSDRFLYCIANPQPALANSTTGSPRIDTTPESIAEAKLIEAHRLDVEVAKLREEESYSAAIGIAEHALEIREEALGSKHQAIARSLMTLASLHQEQRNHIRAEELYRRALRTLKRNVGIEHPIVARCLTGISAALFSQQKYLPGEKLCSQALEILEREHGANHLNITYCLELQSMSLMNLPGRYEEAERFLQRSLSIKQDSLPKEHVSIAETYSLLGDFYFNRGDLVAAEPMYNLAKEILEKRSGKVAIAGAIRNRIRLANLLQSQCRFEDSELLISGTLRISRNVFGNLHPLTRDCMSALGDICWAKGDFEKAQSLIVACLEISEKEYGSNHPITANDINNLALVYQKQKRPGVEALLKRALRIHDSVSEANHPSILGSLSNLANYYEQIGDLPAAIPIFERARFVADKNFDPGHPSLEAPLSDLARANVRQGEVNKALDLFNLAQKSNNLFSSNVLPTLTQIEQNRFIAKNSVGNLSTSLSFALLSKQPEVNKCSVAWLGNSKGAGQRALAERNLLLREVNDPQKAELVSRLISVRERMARLAMSIADLKNVQKRQATIQQLSSEEQELSVRLGAVTKRRSLNQWIDHGALQVGIPPNSTLVDIARFRNYDFKAVGNENPWGGHRYVAWVTFSGDKETKIIDLGPAEPIEELVQQIRGELKNSTDVLENSGEEQAVRKLQSNMQALSDKIWQPVAKELGEVENVILSPDGMLWLAPWSALPLGETAEGKTRYLIEKYNLRLVTSARDLLKAPDTRPTKKPVVFANPSFSQTAAEKRDSIQRIFKKLPKEDKSSTRSISTKSVLPQVQPLPNTGVEADSIEPQIYAYTNSKPIIYKEGRALEHAVKKLKNPKIAAFATHGFFLPEQEVERKDNRFVSTDKRRSIVLDKNNKPLENPLLRCGLLLAGCNDRNSVVGDDDGILTGMEITGIDFRGTELVVLSACDTGVGDIRNGEGVAGLRQAFQLAGAESVLASLWQVDDAETARLMNLFFENLSKGLTKSESLRQAQLSRIKARRARHGAAHPFFWAAFTLTGQD